jgi:hypothetical protein
MAFPRPAPPSRARAFAALGVSLAVMIGGCVGLAFALDAAAEKIYLELINEDAAAE